MATIKLKHTVLAAYLILLVPVVIFFFGWLRWYYAVAATAILAFGFIWLYRSDYLEKKDSVKIPWVHLVLIIAALGLWTAMSGSCGVSLSLRDITWRNTILRDLISYSWPLYYDTGYAMAYYVVFWMVPALVGKAFGWGAALFTLWIWETLTVSVSVLLIAHLLKADKPSVFWMIAGVFMFWSGLNLVGSAITEVGGVNLYGFSMTHNESYLDAFFNGESTNFYYRSNIDCIEESYNQIALWLCVPLMLGNRKIHSFIFLGVLLLPYSPWALLGIIPLMLVLGCVEMIGYIKKSGAGKGLLKTLKELFSIPNLAMLLGCVVIFVTFFMSGAHMSGASGAATSSSSGHAFGLLTFSKFRLANWATYLIFICCEFLVFALFLYKENKRDPLFWVMLIWLMIAPLVWVGTISGRDFCMDGSLPALFVLMIYMMQHLKDKVMGKPLGFFNLAFVVVLTIAMASPALELCYQVEKMYAAKSISVMETPEKVYSFEGQPLDSISNFVCADPSKSFFFKYLAKPL